MDYSKVTMVEYQAKKRAIFESLGATSPGCGGVKCEKCPLCVDGICSIDGNYEYENPIKAIKTVMEYEIPVDWTKIAVDTPILVSATKQYWCKRHFAKFENGVVFAFNEGTTSWSRKGEDSMTKWRYAKLANTESEDE